MENLKINISNLNDGEHKFEFEALPDEFALENDEIVLIDEIKIIATLYKTGSEISADIVVNGKFRLLCDRCVEDYEYDFKKSFVIIYKVDFKGEKTTEVNDDIKFISPNVKFIDLKSDVRDYILLSIPMKKVPEEKDGVCLYCHRNIYEMLNIKREETVNPVWEKLLKTKSK